ncbi:hypothetical protein J1P26_25245 [Neobacillus sp. MM2021_6]|uniref:hypothetical protein n=1 Tax=Bacillaceae TaxID=186817 RepID=UPI00140BF245|nr:MULTISPECIES: hypothetical protein [Bacillaceae]MBO0962966.1 hypothetical protein [Neobacillus sp. MM2021_6]NHC21505.1 hypothetical protein [Bacillus sp. MM2020_4]
MEELSIHQKGLSKETDDQAVHKNGLSYESDNEGVIKEFRRQNPQPFLSRNNSMDDWLFGGRRMSSRQQALVSMPQQNNNQNQIDFKQVMETIDMAYNTWKQYKPLFNGLSPIVDKVKNKLPFKK